MVKMYKILEMKRHLSFNEPKEKISMAESWKKGCYGSMERWGMQALVYEGPCKNILRSKDFIKMAVVNTEKI